MNTNEPKPAQAGPSKAKAKPKIPRQPMPEQDPRRRRTNFEEVPRGYTEETAMLEASRCIQCKKPGCVAGCPVNINIPAFIKKIAEGKFVDALIKLKEQTALPAVCGRVCPQESQCEAGCILGKKGDPVAIGRLERFAADYARKHGGVPDPVKAAATGKRVAVVGAGPAGQVLRLDPSALARGPAPLSSHGLGVAEAIELARALGLPALASLAVIGVAIDPPARAGAAMSPAVAAAIAPAVELVLALAT